MIKKILSQIFKLGHSKEHAICPPHQVFANPDFIFSLTIGGHLVDNEKEYKALMDLLKELGEDEFYLVENLGATITKQLVPFKLTTPINSNFHYFDQQVKSFDPPFGFISSHFFVFGKNLNWGIYICEYPTVNIIGCVPDLAKKFRKVFRIKGNGYCRLEPFIKQEFANNKLLAQFIKNYKLK